MNHARHSLILATLGFLLHTFADDTSSSRVSNSLNLSSGGANVSTSFHSASTASSLLSNISVDSSLVAEVDPTSTVESSSFNTGDSRSIGGSLTIDSGLFVPDSSTSITWIFQFPGFLPPHSTLVHNSFVAITALNTHSNLVPWVDAANFVDPPANPELPPIEPQSGLVRPTPTANPQPAVEPTPGQPADLSTPTPTPQPAVPNPGPGSGPAPDESSATRALQAAGQTIVVGPQGTMVGGTRLEPGATASVGGVEVGIPSEPELRPGEGLNGGEDAGSGAVGGSGTGAAIAPGQQQGRWEQEQGQQQQQGGDDLVDGSGSLDDAIVIGGSTFVLGSTSVGRSTLGSALEGVVYATEALPTSLRGTEAGEQTFATSVVSSGAPNGNATSTGGDLGTDMAIVQGGGSRRKGGGLLAVFAAGLFAIWVLA